MGTSASRLILFPVICLPPRVLLIQEQQAHDRLTESHNAPSPEHSTVLKPEPTLTQLHAIPVQHFTYVHCYTSRQAERSGRIREVLEEPLPPNPSGSQEAKFGRRLAQLDASTTVSCACPSCSGTVENSRLRWPIRLSPSRAQQVTSVAAQRKQPNVSTAVTSYAPAFTSKRTNLGNIPQ